MIIALVRKEEGRDWEERMGVKMGIGTRMQHERGPRSRSKSATHAQLENASLSWRVMTRLVSVSEVARTRTRREVERLEERRSREERLEKIAQRSIE